jgi:alkanesulfonate monooxygenase SsuD/methylene tetrahydromethanopterin reductase-like flavin-dependent oxidoreductase (luciferase family)
MSWRISILDKSPIAENETAADALARTLALAQQAENLGYHRFWIAEHHNTPSLPALAGAADCLDPRANHAHPRRIRRRDAPALQPL